jgi:hypothetical protein
VKGVPEGLFALMLGMFLTNYLIRILTKTLTLKWTKLCSSPDATIHRAHGRRLRAASILWNRACQSLWHSETPASLASLDMTDALLTGKSTKLSPCLSARARKPPRRSWVLQVPREPWVIGRGGVEAGMANRPRQTWLTDRRQGQLTKLYACMGVRQADAEKPLLVASNWEYISYRLS